MVGPEWKPVVGIGDALAGAIENVRAAERERCAKVCEAIAKRLLLHDGDKWEIDVAEECAAAIRKAEA